MISYLSKVTIDFEGSSISIGTLGDTQLITVVWNGSGYYVFYIGQGGEILIKSTLQYLDYKHIESVNTQMDTVIF